MRDRWLLGLGLAIALGGCRDVALPPGREPFEADAESAPEQPDSGPSRADAPEGGASPVSQPVTDAPVGGATEAPSDCHAEPVTLEEVHAGRVRPGLAVSLGELRATSQKFLLSEAKSGSCLWGAFVADPERSGAGSGLLLVSFGVPHDEGNACQPGSDGLPDDLAPGDRLEVQGFLDEYAPASCPEVVAAWQLRVDVACPVRRVGSAGAPEPLPIDLELADRLAAGRDRELLRAWGGALVRLGDVSARQDPEDLDAVFPFGVIELQQSALSVHSRLYYFDLSQGGPRAPGKAPVLSYPTRFDHVSGVVFLDYCTWALGPRDPCRDLLPPSRHCAAQAQGP
ncbi:MAG TPA: hypothetical protein VJN18_06870 [Polyangiaceae bacterium]|nr:hypothetical protein [Polyangiaceae bacterium]